jgi:iron complex transport system permease protein
MGYCGLLLGLLLLLALSAVCGVVFGPVEIDVETVFQIVVNHLLEKPAFEPHWKRSTEIIVWQIRFPRVVMGAIAGMGLSLAGICMQTLTKNALAEPYVLGLSSGASTGAVAVIVLGPFHMFVSFAVPAGAFLGALLSALLVFFIVYNNGTFTATKLVLTGMAVSAIFMAITNILVFSAQNEQQVRSALYWMTGSISGTKWHQLPLPLIVVTLSALILQVFSRALNGLILGDNLAVTLGINVKALRNLLLVLSSLLTGIIVAHTGVIGFVGLVVPHAARTLVGSDHARLNAISCILGAILVIWADVGARIAFAPEEMPIGVITALIGAPFFLWLLKKGRYSFGSDR